MRPSGGRPYYTPAPPTGIHCPQPLASGYQRESAEAPRLQPHLSTDSIVQTSPAAYATNAPGPGDIQPVAHETRDRIVTGLVSVVPFLALGLVAWQVWDQALHWHDLIVLAILYVPTALGVTVGFHRHLTHRSFATTKQVRAVLAALGSAAIEGPVISWVADHRKHHAFSDQDGDPHSPHVGHEGRWRVLRGLVHAHMGWLFVHTGRAAKQRFAPDLIDDPIIRFIDRSFVLWVALGLAAPFGLGVAIGGTVTAGLTGLLWGGAVRIFLLHHVTYSINSLCHFFGKQRFETGDESRNLAWLAIPSFGEAWHNNHHAFPTSARHGLRRVERLADLSGLVIRMLERSGLAWDVVTVSPERMERKATNVA
jgi:stearoyl-CoA desaturase (delta-9 desaturase)